MQQELQSDIVEWADATFGEEHPIDAILKHLVEEAEDLGKSPYNAMSYADIIILLLTAAHKAGYNVAELVKAVETKMVLNKSRVWQKPDAKGITRHDTNKRLSR